MSSDVVNGKGRVVVFAVVVTVLVLGAATYGLVEFFRTKERNEAPADVAEVSLSEVQDVPHVVFRSTAIGDSYGLVAMAPLSDPNGSRAFTDVACDRVDAGTDEAVCLRTKRGVVTTFEAQLLDDAFSPVSTWPLPGIPSRTRLSPDGGLVGSTVFVSGHSYMTTGFSTATVVRTAAGEELGNLEDFTLVADGKAVSPVDRNYWGLTFAEDGNTFYATVAYDDSTWLVRGDLARRRMTRLVENVECPSLSPDGTRIAYKKDVGGSTKHWTPAVLDLGTGEQIVMEREKRSIDDQILWLDDETLLYGMPREDAAGVTDVWQVGIGTDEEPSVYIEQAWSPSVVR